MKINFKECLLIVAISLLFGNFAQAVGVGVKPTRLDLSVKAGQELVTEFLVINVAEVPAMYQVYPDAMIDEIKVDPADFQLEPGSNKIVKIKVEIKNPGRFSTNISVVARPLGAGGLVAASGVKVPIEIVSSGIPFGGIILGLLAICLVVIFTLLLIKRRKKPKRIDKLNFL